MSSTKSSGAAALLTSGVDPTDVGGRQSRLDEILEAALHLFAEQGYVGTTMSDIGAAMGMRGPSLYKHVPSKQILLAAIIVGSMNDLMHDHRRALESSRGVDDQLHRAVVAHVSFQASHRLEALVSLRENRFLESPHRSEMTRLHRQFERSFRSIIERGCKEGIYECNPQLASYAIIDMGISMVTWFRPDGPFSSDEIARYYGDMARKVVTRSK